MSYNLPCDWKSAFVPPPSTKPRIGYLASFNGLGLPGDLKQDMSLVTLYTLPPKYTGITVDTSGALPKVTCAGVVESFSWGGGPKDPLCISVYVSTDNATAIAALVKTGVLNTAVSKLAWWICNYDEENKTWFEEAFPKNPVTVAGQISAVGGTTRITVADTPVKIAPNIDVSVYQVYFEIVPAGASASALQFASSSKVAAAVNWGGN